jgi:tetratricopeptide (TPR) repeat protein
MRIQISSKKPLFILLFVAVTSLAQSQSSDTFINEGNVYFSQKNYNAAIQSYSAAIRVDNNNVRALNGRARAYLEMGEPDKALPDFNVVLRIDPSNVDAYANRGSAYYKKKMYDAAILDLTRAINLSPKFVWAYNKRGLCYYFSNDFYKAINDFTVCIDMEKILEDAYPFRANAYVKTDKLDSAIHDFDIAVDLFPQSKSILNDRGLCLNKMGLYKESVSDFNKCIELDENSARAYINVISPLVRLGDYKLAYALYEEYKRKGLKSHLEAGNYEPLRMYLEALKLFIDGKSEDALVVIHEAIIKLGPKFETETARLFVDILHMEGVISEDLKMLEDAMEVYDQSLAINPNQPDVEERLNKLYKDASVVAAADKAAPEIEIITPGAANIELGMENASIQIEGKAKDPSGIEFVKINGIAVEKLDEDGWFISHITLVTGENNLVFTASDKQGNVSTTSIKINATAQLTPNNTRGTSIVGKGDGKTAIVMETTPIYHAILIAEQNYIDPKFNDLQNPRNDALELGKILGEKYGFPASNIDMLFDLSREEIIGAIIRKSGSLKNNENLIIFYAGHGMAEKDKGGEVEGYWIPSSATYGLVASYISTNDIKQSILRSDAKHILVIADACFSGALTRGFMPDAPNAIERQYFVPSRKVMASGNLTLVPDESVFIRYMKKRLIENNEKYLAAFDLFSSFRSAVLNNSKTEPQYSAIKNVGDEGGEFIFIKKE